jgi:hypothetical protein
MYDFSLLIINKGLGMIPVSRSERETPSFSGGMKASYAKKIYALLISLESYPFGSVEILNLS